MSLIQTTDLAPVDAKAENGDLVPKGIPKYELFTFLQEPEMKQIRLRLRMETYAILAAGKTLESLIGKFRLVRQLPDGTWVVREEQ